MILRSVTHDDREAIIDLVRAAFSTGGRDGSDEVDITRQTWAQSAQIGDLELVAVDEGRLVGHVLTAWADLGGRPVAAVAPLAVIPDRQGHGIGSRLMNEVVARADAMELPLIVLLGSPLYYARFGFEPSGPLDITYRAVGEGDPHFQVRRLSRYDSSYRGDVAYCWER